MHVYTFFLFKCIIKNFKLRIAYKRFAILRDANEYPESVLVGHSLPLSCSVGNLFCLKVRDLLSEELEPVGLEVDPVGALLLTGLTRIHCSSIPEVLACLDAGIALI